ncbi:Transport and Golgi organization 2-like protein [Rhynchospora pubera]|uniref:Transport and Golgi organization 2-like protein n=1 Tax=Rhynchospora pubera TaxID=906938 RepID=A0AAV8EB01_9POAL|nr:Transport and Golgi organization 2-like protein [Rhynchospora pubera]
MCIAAWIWQAHPVYPFLLLFNRDEFHDRPTKPADWWGEGAVKILGGRDVVGGGTWLGCTKEGKLAFLTNVLEPEVDPIARTRGDLPVRFLQGKKSPLDYAKEVAKEAKEYNGFNLILADLCKREMVYVSNRPKGRPAAIQIVPPGLHVLTNATLDSPWQKVVIFPYICLYNMHIYTCITLWQNIFFPSNIQAIRLGTSFKELLLIDDDKDMLAKNLVEKLMTDRSKADIDMLPNTGCDIDYELNLSAIFVEIKTKQGIYGTRSTAVLSMKENGDVSFYEKFIEAGIWKEHTLEYCIE